MEGNKYDHSSTQVGTHFPVLSTDELIVKGKKLGGGIVTRVPLLTGDSIQNPEVVGRRLNELITALKAAGIMENK